MLGPPSPVGLSGEPHEGHSLTWALASACFLHRVLTELVSKMRDMHMDKTELGCLRAIVLFNPGTAPTTCLLLAGGGPRAPSLALCGVLGLWVLPSKTWRRLDWNPGVQKGQAPRSSQG